MRLAHGVGHGLEVCFESRGMVALETADAKCGVDGAGVEAETARGVGIEGRADVLGELGASLS